MISKRTTNRDLTLETLQQIEASHVRVATLIGQAERLLLRAERMIVDSERELAKVLDTAVPERYDTTR
jgi:hypothetical protein